jgi:TonB-linked SusC/RagA family outer membrane protein
MSILTLSLYAQSVTVRGTVSDANGEVLQGVSIAVKGSTSGVVSDANGVYSISVADRSAVLVFSFVGFVKQEIAVGERTELNVTLEEDTQELDELVVVGYGTQKKVHLSGAVATISAKALADRPVNNAAFALQGLSPNVNITRPSGKLNAVSGINIRGYTSVNGGEAFILVDNVPTSNEEFARINPADIESISFLKDAASAAIYGARAAFGVVLVTTKTAKSEKIQIDASYNYALKQAEFIPDVMTDIPMYMEMANVMSGDPYRFNEAAIDYARRRMSDRSLPEILGPGRENGGINDRQINAGEWEYYGIYNWYEVMMKSAAPSQTANVRISQKTDKLAYALSGGLYSEDGMLRHGYDDYTRLNLRANGTYSILDRWTVGSNIAFNRLNYDSNVEMGEGEVVFYRMHSNYPTQPIYNPDGTPTQDGGQNVSALHSGGFNRQTVNDIQLAFNTKVYILKDVWSVSGDATFKMYFEDKSRLVVPTTYQNKPGKPRVPSPPNMTENRNRNQMTVYNLYTNFDKTFAGKHFVSAMAGFNQEYFIYNNTEFYGEKLITLSVPNIELTQENRRFTQGTEDYALRGTFGRLTYIFDNKYIIEGNGRYDGTSRFTKGKRFGFFPSYSAAWVVSKERFMEGISEKIKLSHLKFRFSDGTLGSQANLGYYPTVAGMGMTNQISKIVDGSRPQAMNPPGASPGSLTWEKVRSVNGAVELGFFNDRLSAELDVYTRYTTGMLTDGDVIPATFGVGAPRQNSADLKTKGWDLSLGWRDAFELAGSTFSYNVRLTLSDTRAWITRFDNNPNKLLGSRADDGSRNGNFAGKRMGDIWGYTTIGYFESDAEAAAWADQSAINSSSAFKAGDIKFADINNDGKINEGDVKVDNPGDMSIIGNSSQRFPYGINLGAEWKGFDFSLFLQGVGKRDAYSPEGMMGIWFWGIYTTPWANPNNKNADHWTPENPDAFYPRMKTTGASQGLGWDKELAKPQTKYLQDASYLRVKNLMLGYTVPREWLQKAKIRSLRVYFSGENLLTFHHIQVKGNDPERFGSVPYYPFSRMFSFGINLGF